MSVVPISGTKELASRIRSIVWRTRSNTFVLIPLLELTLAVAQHHAGFILKVTFVRGYILSPCLRGTRDGSLGGGNFLANPVIPDQQSTTHAFSEIPHCVSE